MSVIDEVLVANELYSRTHELRRLTPRPGWQVDVTRPRKSGAENLH